MLGGKHLVLAGLLVAFSLLFVPGVRAEQQPQLLGQIFEPNWSPDGARIAFSVDDPRLGLDVYTVNVRTKRIANLTRDLTAAGVDRASGAAWSPDSTRLVFTVGSPRAGYADLWLMNADGTGKRLLLHDAREASWSPDGRKIVCWVENYANTDLLRILTPSGRILSTIDLRQRYKRSFNPHFPVWSPDGTRIAFASTEGTDVIPVKAGPVKTVGPGNDISGVLSRDWKHIVWLTPTDDLYTADIPFRHTHRLLHGRTPITGISWSLDDRKLAFTSNKEDGTDRTLYTINSNGRGLTVLARH